MKPDGLNKYPKIKRYTANKKRCCVRCSTPIEKGEHFDLLIYGWDDSMKFHPVCLDEFLIMEGPHLRKLKGVPYLTFLNR